MSDEPNNFALGVLGIMYPKFPFGYDSLNDILVRSKDAAILSFLLADDTGQANAKSTLFVR